MNRTELNLKLNLEICANDGVTVVYCRGRLAYREEATALSEAVAELLLHSRHVVLELSAVEMIDSACLGELVVILMWARASRCSIKLAAPPRHIRALLELTNLDSVFEIYPTLDDAALACREQAA
ncbi:MAG: STAS domain-containing protein [Acidobacteriia bacterium]|nr:STAS domain-containing protein [Terriglobia bacterium]